MNSKMKSWTVSWLSLKTKVEPGLRGSRVMSGDWRRLHRVRGVSGGSPENHWVPWLIHKAKTEESKTEVHILRQHTFWHAWWDHSRKIKMPDITDIMDVNIEDLSPEQRQQLQDAVDQF
jgi:hypothetical protein